MLEEVDLFAGFFVACEREDGLPRLRLWSFTDRPADNADWRNCLPRAGLQRLIPTSTASSRRHVPLRLSVAGHARFRLRVRPRIGDSNLLKQLEVPGGFDRTLYASERIHATAADGVQVPISLVYRKGQARAGPAIRSTSTVTAPTATRLPLGFNSNRLSLLDRGVVMAYAHIRGGGDLGKPWHDAGKMLVKRNTFTDFIAAVEHLTASGYGDPARVAIEGGSAGGLLMGAVTNMRPDLFRVVLSHVPFVDVMNTMLDASLPLTVPEYEEWGDPNEDKYFKYMLSYSPYDNLKPASYPAMLVKTWLHDSQVMYWEPAKYVAKLRTLKTDDQPAAAGHQYEGRPRRRQRPLRLPQRDRLRLRLPAEGTSDRIILCIHPGRRRARHSPTARAFLPVHICACASYLNT